MRIAFIRSVDVKQANPTLKNIKSYAVENDIKLKLFYTDGICNSELFPGEFEKVAEDIGADALSQKIIEWEADVVISISLPDNNAHRDSYIKELLETKHRIPVIMHPIKTTTLLSNKWETNQWLKRKGYKVPNSILVYGDLLSKRTVTYVSYIQSILSQVKDFQGPYFIKPLWDSMSTGVKKINNIDELENFIYKEKIQYDFVIEEQVTGGLFGLEVVGHNGEYFCQPLVKKCNDTTDSLVPFDHVRFGPYVMNQNVNQALQKDFIEISKNLDICGSVEFEFIGNETGFYIIEINPRVSGMTNLSSAISGVNTYTSLLQLAMEREPNNISQDRFTLELPLINMSQDKLNDLSCFKEIFSINDVIYHNGTKQYKMLLQVDSLDEATQYLSALNMQLNIIPSHVFSEIAQENLILNEERSLV